MAIFRKCDRCGEIAKSPNWSVKVYTRGIEIDLCEKCLSEIRTWLFEKDLGNISDGYHTFNELYHHRAVLFANLCNMSETSWKSKKHNDGTMYDDMFIAGIDTPDGPATYHFDIDPYWDLFRCEELEFAPEWDGHTPDQAVERLMHLAECAKLTPQQIRQQALSSKASL